MNYFRRGCSWLADALLPQQCALCRLPTGSAAPLCPVCAARLPRLPVASCPRCASASAVGVVCGHCLTVPPAFTATGAAFVYAGEVEPLVQALKYGHQLRLAGWFGERVAEVLAEQKCWPDFDAVLPMPLHPARLRRRGFNQSLEIARPLARRLGRPLLGNVVERTRDTPPQVGLTRAERLRNLRDAFSCDRDLSGQTLLVVDDVMSTGASADELARTLKLHGAAAVFAACVARTLAA